MVQTGVLVLPIILPIVRLAVGVGSPLPVATLRPQRLGTVAAVLPHIRLMQVTPPRVKMFPEHITIPAVVVGVIMSGHQKVPAGMVVVVWEGRTIPPQARVSLQAAVAVAAAATAPQSPARTVAAV